MKEFHLFVPNLETFLKNTNLEWVFSLNSDVNIDLTSPSELNNPSNKAKQMQLRLTDQSKMYTFPEEDFCALVNFPHSQLVFPVIESADDLECTCTLIWLTQYYPFYSEIDDLLTTSVSKCNYKNDFDQQVANCNFEDIKKECLQNTFESTEISTSHDTSTVTTSSAQITTITNSKPDKCEFSSILSLLKCENIVNLSNINANEASISSIETLFIKPKDSIKLTSKLNFSGSSNNFKKGFDVILENFSGFNLNANPFENFKVRGDSLDLSELNFVFFSSNHDDASLSDVCTFVKTSYKPLF